MLLGLKVEEVSVPCDQTIQNWVSKLGYYHLGNLDNEYVGKEVCLFIDESIRVGTERLFMGLVCPYEKTKDSALSFEDVRVVYLQGSDSWTGDKIALELSKTLKEKQLDVKYVVSDEGNNLKKGIQLMNYNHLPDISHLIGTCLRHGFSKATNYKAFISDIGRCQAKLAMGKYCYCRPPKQRAKARFMNQAKVVNWAEIVFEKWESFENEMKVKLSMIPQHKQLITQLAAALNLAKKITLALKKTGLNKKTIKKAIKQTAAELKKAAVDSCYHFFLQRLNKYLEYYESFTEKKDFKGKTVYVCSDIIESLFGKYKAKASDNQLVSVTNLCLELPLMCLPQKKISENINTIFSEVKMSNLETWNGEQKSKSQALMRVEFLKSELDF
jgi:hypothetical protein